MNLYIFSCALKIIIIIKKRITKQLLEDIKTQEVNFIVIYIILKILMLFKITRTLKSFLRSIIDFSFFKKINNFFHNMEDGSSKFEE